MIEGLHDDQQFGEFGLSNDEGAARKRASLAADFEAQVAAKRAAKAAQEDAAQKAMQSPVDGREADSAEPSPSVDERVFSERVAYGDVRHMSKNFYKGLIASVVVVVIVVIAVVILGQASL
ncbi:MAG: hypothetical protein Q4D34_04300 [Eggerthellaceae bacterium]|nr:hypothetical protein [Eggerthellaceae bacterium]